MFRNRKNSQKPADGLYASFKQHFPEIGPGTTSTSEAPSHSTPSLSDALLDPSMNTRHPGERDDAKDQDITPRGQHEPWRFTPSLLDTNSFSFASFANQPPGYYTPTPGGMNTLYHNQAGDLHTPAMGFQLGTPLSMPMSEVPVHAGSSFDIHGFQTQVFSPEHFQHANTFPQQQSYAPSSFVHQDSGYEAMDGSPGNEMDMSADHHRGAQMGSINPHMFEGSMAAPPLPSVEKFRYHVTLNAPTAMIRHADEIPVTYLNKGQAYSVSIIDSMPLGPSPVPVKYRTVIRISFEDEQQRQRPAACWQLWKEGRGLAEAHQRGGKLQAVEYVDPHPGGDDDNRRPRVDLESASFDSFSVTWSPCPTAASTDCSVAVRFNFLSTDFSHSKGVKGIPVRLCAKTELISSGTPDSPPGANGEVCFSKVKLFRDHGAERKLANDVAHVKKTIEKLKQQINQAEAGVKDFGKRKRSGSMTGRSGERPGKVQKHKRTWSASSQSSTGPSTIEDDLQQKLANVQDMFTSTRPVSVLYLRGLEQDDPDLYPVLLPGEPQDLMKVQNFARRESWDQRPSVDITPTSSSIVSPSPSSASVHSQPVSKERSTFQAPSTFDPSQPMPSEWVVSTAYSQPDFASNLHNVTEVPSRIVTLPKGGNGAELPIWIEALGVDSSYKPPPERLVKPVACFYVLVKVCGKTPADDYYRAIYLMKRTVKDLIQNIAAKCGVDPNRVQRALRVNDKGLKIVVDDEVVRELPEGQDMSVEFNKIESDIAVKEEENAFTVDQSLSDFPVESLHTKALEMKLLF